jgi:hypothetical protein
MPPPSPHLHSLSHPQQLSHPPPRPSLTEDQIKTKPETVFSPSIERLYREITKLETKVKQEDLKDDADDVMSGRVVLKGKEVENDDLGKGKWKVIIKR